jgi:plasmid replication initiation protein
MKNELVVKSNQVIEASYRLSVVEQRVILSAIAKIPKMCEVSDDEIYTVSVQDLQALGVHEKTAYRDLKEAVNRLYERSISLDIDDKLIKMRWVQRIEFTDNQGIVALRFSKDILPFISNVKANFTQYMLSEVSKMQGAYSVRVYELLVQYKTTGERSISIEDFRFMLDLGTRYKQFNDLLKRVIAPSIEEINEQTDLKVTAEPQKIGRKFTHIKFTIKQKPKPKLIAPERDPNTPDFFIKLSDPQRHLFANIMSEMPEMGSYSQGTESFQQFAVRIANMLLEPEKFRELFPFLLKAGYIPPNT